MIFSRFTMGFKRSFCFHNEKEDAPMCNSENFLIHVIVFHYTAFWLFFTVDKNGTGSFFTHLYNFNGDFALSLSLSLAISWYRIEL